MNCRIDFPIGSTGWSLSHTHRTNDSLPPYLLNNLNFISNYVPVTAWSPVNKWDGKRRRSRVVCNLYLLINIDMSGVSSIAVFPSIYLKKGFKKWYLTSLLSLIHIWIRLIREEKKKEEGEKKANLAFKHRAALYLGAAECTLREDNYHHPCLSFPVFITTMIVCSPNFAASPIQYLSVVTWLFNTHLKTKIIYELYKFLKKRLHSQCSYTSSKAAVMNMVTKQLSIQDTFEAFLCTLLCRSWQVGRSCIMFMSYQENR